MAYVRIVDKHPSAVWAFCRQWAWDQRRKFAHEEGYNAVDSPLQQVCSRLQMHVTQHQWNPRAHPRVALMYLLGKAKSLRLPAILWRPIAAVSCPFVSRHALRIAFTCFLRCFTEEITASILVLRVMDIAPWVQHLSDWGATFMGEADCKEQFNRIEPATTVQELRDASQFLYHRKRRGASSIIWSIHRDSKALDRAGKATSASFWHFSHEELIGIVNFSLTEDNYVWCPGSLWQRTDAIPMGGSFSAQCADLHSLWGLKTQVEAMKHSGKLMRTKHVLLWLTPAGNTVSLSQLRDNVNVAAKGPSANTEMSRVCATLTECWGQLVVCDCLSKGNPCVGNCMQPSLRILGLTIHLHELVVCYSTPSALDDMWQLKWGPSLHSLWAMSSAILGNIFTGSLINGMPFHFSWVCFLLSISTWPQMAVLCHHPVAAALRAMKVAIHKYCARSAWCVDASIAIQHLGRDPHAAAPLFPGRKAPMVPLMRILFC